MSEHTKTIGTVTTYDGATVTIGRDCSLVTISMPPGGVRLTRQQRDEMDRLMFTADAEAEAWSRQNGPEPARCEDERTSGLSLACLNGDDQCCGWQSCRCDCHAAATASLSTGCMWYGSHVPDPRCTVGCAHDATQCNGVHLEASDL